MSFLNQLLDWAHQCLLGADEAQAYLLGRGISIEQWARHRIGFIGGAYEVLPEQDSAHSDACFHKDTKHLRCDACHYRAWSSTWEGDDGTSKDQRIGQRIQNSIVFPLTSYSGTCVGFQVRSLVEKSYDTFTLRRRPEGFFFGTAAAMESIWATQEVNLVEGPPDHLIFERLISPNVLALTTNSVGVAHLRFLRRFVRRVNLCLDLDKAGRDGVKSFLEYEAEFDQVRNIKYAKFQDGVKDINDLWKRVGDEKFKKTFANLY